MELSLIGGISETGVPLLPKLRLEKGRRCRVSARMLISLAEYPGESLMPCGQSRWPLNWTKE